MEAEQEIILTLGNDISEEELSVFVSKIYMDKWKTSHDYQTNKPVNFKSKEIDPKILCNPQFIAFSFYVNHLIEKAIAYRFNELGEMVGKEFKEWDSRGGLCIYTSILHYCLLLESKVIPEKDIQLIQGFYSHPTHGILSLISNLQNQAGLHAFITVGGSVVDFSINQESNTFDFPDGPFIIGDIPDEMNLGGWIEGKDVAKKYAREIARSHGLNYYEWIDKHIKNAFKIAVEEIREKSMELEEKLDGKKK